MLSAYPACFIKEKTAYSVIFPDLNYLATSGETYEEALNMAVDCLAGYLYTLEKDGEKAPEPSSVDSIDIEALARELEVISEEKYITIITVDVKEYAKEHFEKAVKKTLTIPIWLNNMALENQINFSQVLQEALKEKLCVNEENFIGKSS